MVKAKVVKELKFGSFENVKVGEIVEVYSLSEALDSTTNEAEKFYFWCMMGFKGSIGFVKVKNELFGIDGDEVEFLEGDEK